MSAFTDGNRKEVAMGTRRSWVFSPHAGGSRISPSVQADTRHRILTHAERRYAGRYSRLDVRFRGALCYIDAYCEPEPPSKALLRLTGETRAEFVERLRATPIHLCRLRYSGGPRRWTVAFYAYSSERYEPAAFPSGDFFGTPEEALDLGAVYL